MTTTLATRLLRSIEIHNEQSHYPLKTDVEIACVELITVAQFEIWKILTTYRIQTGEVSIVFSLRSTSEHSYLSKYEYKTNLNILLLKPSGKAFTQWLKEQGLDYRIMKTDDGFGRESWDELHIVLAEQQQE